MTPTDANSTPRVVPDDSAEPGRVGRKRDPSRDAVILDAALDVLAEVGYAGFTMDLVATRARAGKATVYRRWSSKGELLHDAVGHLRRIQVDLHCLPDTGTLRGDLVGLIPPSTVAQAEHRLKVMSGLGSMLGQDAELTDAVNEAIYEPWVTAYRVFFQRAIDRGEIPEPADLDSILEVMPGMAAFRVLVQRRTVDRDYLVGLIDAVLLPALGLR